ncbi:MAG TPA: DUF4013 domain-containing protein [Gemmataceae bacterium]|nr:DUF4013 domain-containing protein [Gemmataceae bacterium]
MRYLQSYGFVFSNRNWGANVMFAILCSLIPAIGPIVLIGYFFEVIEFLLGSRPSERDKASDYPLDAIRAADYPSDAFSARPLNVLPADPDPETQAYPDFTFDRFSEYLMRGVWPFLVRLIVSLPVALLFPLVFMMGMIGIGVSGGTDSGVGVAIFFIGIFLVSILVGILIGVLSTPLYLRAGLSRDFGSAFSMPFFRDFLRRVGKELVLAELFLAGTSSALSLLGVMACYVGIFPALALIMFAHHHLEFQLYKLYLERGGIPVEVKGRRSLNVMRGDDEEW